MDDKLNKTFDDFLTSTKVESQPDGTEEVCDLQTGEYYTIKTKDGLVERINKRYIIEDGRQLLTD